MAPGTLTLDEYRVGREDFFPTSDSLRRFIRRNCTELIEADAVRKPTGRWRIRVDAFDGMLESIGKRRARPPPGAEHLGPLHRRPLPFAELIARWLLDDPCVDEFTIVDVVQKALKLDASSVKPDVLTRVGIALSRLQCRRVEKRDRVPRFVYRRPHRNAASSQPSDLVEARAPIRSA